MAKEFRAIYQRMGDIGTNMRIAAYVHALNRMGRAIEAGGTKEYFAGHRGV